LGGLKAEKRGGEKNLTRLKGTKRKVITRTREGSSIMEGKNSSNPVQKRKEREGENICLYQILSPEACNLGEDNSVREEREIGGELKIL